MQVYKGVLKKEGTTVAVKVQRPFVLETVSLDLYLLREAATLASKVWKSCRVSVCACVRDCARG